MRMPRVPSTIGWRQQGLPEEIGAWAWCFSSIQRLIDDATVSHMRDPVMKEL